MQTPVEIDFQGMRGRPEVQASIQHHVAELEQRYGRVTACRVVLKGPGGHQRTGGLYEVNIRLALPNGREINIARTAQADERLADLSFAINDAFKHARRQLQDHVRRLQGQVKQHESQPRQVEIYAAFLSVLVNLSFTGSKVSVVTSARAHRVPWFGRRPPRTACANAPLTTRSPRRTISPSSVRCRSRKLNWC